MKRTKYILGVITLAVTLLITPNNIDAQDNKIYLPLITNTHCGMDDNELNLLTLITGHPDQQRILYCNENIVNAAKTKAYDMALNNYFSHNTLTGTTPNQVAQSNNCALDLSSAGNGVESIIAGTSDYEAAFIALINSPSHRVHLLGLNEQFKEYNSIGIKLGVNENSEYQYYWSIFIAKC